MVVLSLRLWSSDGGGMSSIPGQGTRISHATGHGQQILNIIIIFKGIFLKRNKEIKYSVCLPGSTIYKIVYALNSKDIKNRYQRAIYQALLLWSQDTWLIFFSLSSGQWNVGVMRNISSRPVPESSPPYSLFCHWTPRSRRVLRLYQMLQW